MANSVPREIELDPAAVLLLERLSHDNFFGIFLPDDDLEILGSSIIEGWLVEEAQLAESILFRVHLDDKGVRVLTLVSIHLRESVGGAVLGAVMLVPVCQQQCVIKATPVIAPLLGAGHMPKEVIVFQGERFAGGLADLDGRRGAAQDGGGNDCGEELHVKYIFNKFPNILAFKPQNQAEGFLKF